MDRHLKKVYVPMTETAFYILLCLKKPNHGYGIVQTVEKNNLSEFDQEYILYLIYNGQPSIRREDIDHIRQLIENGKGWFNSVYKGRRQTQNLSNYKFRIGNTANRIEAH